MLFASRLVTRIPNMWKGSPTLRHIKRGLLWGVGLLALVQVASWLAWGRSQLPTVLASGIVEVTGGHFALNSESCQVAPRITPDVCNELRGLESVREQTRRLEAGEWKRACPQPDQCFGYRPQQFWFEAASSYPAVASVQYGMATEVLTGEGKKLEFNLGGEGSKLTYYWVLGVWVRRDRLETTWIS